MKNRVTPKFIPARKAQVFVAHVQDHLNRGITSDRGTRYDLPRGKVGCKICLRTVDRIYLHYVRTGDVGWK